MREVKFPFLDRLVLTPMELVPAFKTYLVFAFAMFLFFGTDWYGIQFKKGWDGAYPYISLGMLSVFAGAFLAPLFICEIPFRSFAIKGWLAGMAVMLVFLTLSGILKLDKASLTAAFIFFPLASSYLALQFTGSTVFTGMSGVKKELKYALPIYVSGAALSIVFLTISRLKHMGAI